VTLRNVVVIKAAGEGRKI